MTMSQNYAVEYSVTTTRETRSLMMSLIFQEPGAPCRKFRVLYHQSEANSGSHQASRSMDPTAIITIFDHLKEKIQSGNELELSAIIK